MARTYNELKDVRYIVSETGKLEFAVLRWKDFERIIETLEIEANPELMASIERARKRFKRGGKLLTTEEV